MEEILKASQAMQAQNQALQAQNQETREAIQAQNKETREALNEALQAQNQESPQNQALQAQNQETREAFQAQHQELKESLGLKFKCLEDEISAVKENVSSAKEEMKDKMSAFEERLAAVETGHPRTPVFQQENNNSDKASFLAAALRGPAVDVLQMIPQQLRLDFNALINALESRYGEEHYQQLYVVNFKNRLQNKKESLQDLALDIRRLARLAYPTCPPEIQDFMAQHQFIDAIEESETQKFARLSSATTLQETLVQAMKYEAAQQATIESYRVARQVKWDNPERKIGRCWTCGAHDHMSSTCPRRVKQRSDTGCWKCGKNGHIRKNCPDKSKDKPERKRDRCWTCGSLDHISPTCTRKVKQRSDTDCWRFPKKNHGRQNDNADALSRRPCVPQSGHCARTESRFCVRQVTVQESNEVEKQHWTGQALRNAQREDRDLLPVINWKESGERPSWEDVTSHTPKTKSLWFLCNSLTLRDGVLYRKWESEDGKHESWKLVLPRSHVPLALQEMHSSPTGDHFGIRKTLAKVREIFCWPGSRTDVEKWCRNCTRCSVRKGPTTRSKGKVKIYNVGAPFGRMLTIHQWAGENLHFSKGEMVWLHNPQRKKGLSPKLQYQWEGPYKITKCLNDVIYRIQKTPTSKPKVVHYNRSTPGYIGMRNSCQGGRKIRKRSRRTKLRGVLQASCCLKKSDCCLPPTPVCFLEDSGRFYELLSPVLLLLSLTVLQLEEFGNEYHTICFDYNKNVIGCQLLQRMTVLNAHKVRKCWKKEVSG
ncbi:K02A2.6-like [Cordylochernes scorpioides]|uniref:K02A2.6-like n=1 Tax=Cordylochernes scorpioides TaxID=51811 RepID=A0ABY6KWL8_9ARAC|nr:K02A2.6-like [Cordylochernes scorpioides]